MIDVDISMFASSYFIEACTFGALASAMRLANSFIPVWARFGRIKVPLLALHHARMNPPSIGITMGAMSKNTLR
jgi:hypothetical protein